MKKRVTAGDPVKAGIVLAIKRHFNREVKVTNVCVDGGEATAHVMDYDRKTGKYIDCYTYAVDLSTKAVSLRLMPVKVVEFSAKPNEFQATFDRWLIDANAKIRAYFGKPDACNALYVDSGMSSRVYVRVLSRNVKYGGCSVYCFVARATGNIYKPASWRGPIKNVVRGNIFNTDALAWVEPYGIRCLR